MRRGDRDDSQCLRDSLSTLALPLTVQNRADKDVISSRVSEQLATVSSKLALKLLWPYLLNIVITYTSNTLIHRDCQLSPNSHLPSPSHAANLWSTMAMGHGINTQIDQKSISGL